MSRGPLNWFRSGGRRPDSTGPIRSFVAEGVIITPPGDMPPAKALDPRPLVGDGLDGLLAQLDDEGATFPRDRHSLLPWDQVFRLLATSDYALIDKALALPPESDWTPELQSHGSLSDRSFAIILADWYDPSGRRLRDVRACGAILEHEGSFRRLRQPVWELAATVASFQARPENDRDDVVHRRLWGAIRRLALSSGARMDGFLIKNVILTPDKLEIGLRKGAGDSLKVVEVIPTFAGAPDAWLRLFDERREVPDRYDIPTPEGIVQVLIAPDVKTVLQAIKRFPGRRVAGARAEAFLINPFAALGEAASTTIDEDQFLEARQLAGLEFDRFTAHIERDALHYPTSVGLTISAPSPDGSVANAIELFSDDAELAAFIDDVDKALAESRQLCAWNGYDFELMGESRDEVERLREALRERREPRVLVSYKTIFDLSQYSSRVEDIGVEKAYYSPFIAKKNDEEGWFPDNVLPIISWIPEGETEPVAVPMTPEVQAQFKAKVEEARSKGEPHFTINGFPKPIPVSDAEKILDTFGIVDDDLKHGRFEPRAPKPDSDGRVRKHLVIKANIQSIDYEEARRDILKGGDQTAQLPTPLRPSTILKDHQLAGVAWLQHLFSHAPNYCRGAVLADDMGLGKTLQLLTFLAWVFETCPDTPPALVVAPVSLLENWAEEVGKFLQPDALRILTAYGESLERLRVPRAAVDAALRADGLVRFLKPGWRGDANVVLTTYETLRDLEFSFAAEKWSVMICDEAQRIKNPNAMVTRAAKKQNVTFRIACTGTPVENTLVDLWCLFDFIQPGLLGALNDFGRRYRRPIEAKTDEEVARVDELRKRIEPQILRRTKAEVAKDLPPKREIPSRVQLSDYQRSLYANAIDLFKRRADPDARSPFQNHLGLLHYLRLICTDPRRMGLTVFRPELLDDYRRRAPKLAWLLTQLKDIQARGEKVIVFCEFKEIQRMLRYYIEETFGLAPDIINGDTSASSSHVQSRQKRIKAFQAKPGFGVIILSPVAVGFGVNIQEANHVIHYTRTWNPAKEDQATDRAYRIGQTREVSVYCPTVFADDFTTFDVKLDQLLTSKRALAGDMLNGTGDVGPGDFALDEVALNPNDPMFTASLTIDDAVQMKWDYFECLIAALWQKKGYMAVYRTPRRDDGVDVVAINNRIGAIIQCKCCGDEGRSLGWDAIKEVVGGEAAYRQRHPGVTFQRVCITNQSFNGTAKSHAELNNVELIGQTQLARLLEEFPVPMKDVEKFLYSSWDES